MEIDSFEQGILQQLSHLQIRESDKVLVAVSGGADSVALLCALLRLKIPCIVAHCNFHLRGQESERDCTFVSELCKKLKVKCVIRDFDVPAYMSQHGVSLEMACRNLRYDWFSEILSEHGCTFVAVAHHQQDNAETFLLNALRGTGIAGVAGMQPLNGKVIRPLLWTSKQEIIAYLSRLHQPYVTDSSNLQSDVQRNYIRNRIMPVVREGFPYADSTLATTVGNMARCHDLYNEGVEIMRQIVCDQWTTEGQMVIDADCLLSIKNATMLLFEILKRDGFQYWQCERMVELLSRHETEAKIFTSSTHIAEVGRRKLKVLLYKEKVEGLSHKTLNINTNLNYIKLNFKPILVTREVIKSLDGKRLVAFNTQLLNCKSIVVRKWQVGDRMRPFGMRGTKLISDLLTEAKYSPEQKRNTQVVEADGEIIWVPGVRAGEKFRLLPEDKECILLSWEPDSDN